MDREAVLVAMTVRDTTAKVIVSLAALANLLREALADMPIPRRAPNPENNTEVPTPRCGKLIRILRIALPAGFRPCIVFLFLWTARAQSLLFCHSFHLLLSLSRTHCANATVNSVSGRETTYPGVFFALRRLEEKFR